MSAEVDDRGCAEPVLDDQRVVAGAGDIEISRCPDEVAGAQAP